ncbi:7TM GPCR serpentine receptor class x (Srx) domain-containing protein [Caenorhabditis elegans]|nr:7TM GPCR serpentine receptor class x (Srx) domain-containing protein [Caenorhabditis elegans]CAP46772.1 7TM GPCR serpentine receptor class x (Srx) domain-containing protein [Caenorhabditis elegans]|eukprot:NP_001122904.1 Serpentine Receptor, class X [Caenorhabditis elegans]
MSNSGVNAEESRARRKRWMVNFTQCVIQDSLQLFDTINAYYMWRFYDAAWYRFLFATLSFILVSALDGFVMFIYHQECLKLITLKWKSTTVEPSPVNSLPSGHRTLIE